MSTICNPHFVYKKTFKLIENDLFEINNAFDIYSLQKDKNKIYLCGANQFKKSILKIFEFKENKFEKKLSLMLHKGDIKGCKYFLNKKLKKEYLVSTDSGNISSNSIIWIIKNENIYEKILIINNKDAIRFPFSIIFNYNKKNNQLYFIHPSSQVDSDVISENNKIYKKINFTEGQILYYLIWENKNDKNYIVQCNVDYIYIYDIFNENKQFTKIENDAINGKNFSANILYNKDNTDILCIINENGNIVFYDLLSNQISFIYKINDDGIVNMCEYNKKYLIFLSKNGFFMLFDYKNKIIINKTGSNQLNKVKTIKMINHDIYGDYIIMGGFMTGLLLYKNIKKPINIPLKNYL